MINSIPLGRASLTINRWLTHSQKSVIVWDFRHHTKEYTKHKPHYIFCMLLLYVRPPTQLPYPQDDPSFTSHPPIQMNSQAIHLTLKPTHQTNAHHPCNAYTDTVSHIFPSPCLPWTIQTGRAKLATGHRPKSLKSAWSVSLPRPEIHSPPIPSHLLPGFS